MNRNSLKLTVQNNEVAVGAKTAITSPTLIEVYGGIGLDFVLIDFEHSGPSPYDRPLIEGLVRAAESNDTELLVRLPSGNPSLVRKVLDAGLRNIIIPRIKTPSDIKVALKAGRFRYAGYPGKRGVAATRRNNWGEFRDGYAKNEDENIMIGAMIENKESVQNIDDILSVDDLGFVFFGPGDLSVSLGKPINIDDNEIVDAYKSVLESCNKHDIPFGRVCTTDESRQDAIEHGCQLIQLGSEILAARKYFRSALASINKESNSL